MVATKAVSGLLRHLGKLLMEKRRIDREPDTPLWCEPAKAQSRAPSFNARSRCTCNAWTSGTGWVGQPAMCRIAM